MVGPTTPLVVLKLVPRFVVYFYESAKYASAAVTRFRRSDFIEARYAFSFLLSNLGIATTSKLSIITTPIRSSISVKPLRFIWTTSPRMSWSCGRRRTIRATPIIPDALRGTNCALDESRHRNVKWERQLRHKYSDVVLIRKAQTSGFLHGLTGPRRTRPSPGKRGDRLHDSISPPKKERRRITPAALMRQARGLTRTSVRLPCWQAPAESNPRKSSRSSSSWCATPSGSTGKPSR